MKPRHEHCWFKCAQHLTGQNTLTSSFPFQHFSPCDRLNMHTLTVSSYKVLALFVGSSDCYHGFFSPLSSEYAWNSWPGSNMRKPKMAGRLLVLAAICNLFENITNYFWARHVIIQKNVTENRNNNNLRKPFLDTLLSWTSKQFHIFSLWFQGSNHRNKVQTIRCYPIYIETS